MSEALPLTPARDETVTLEWSLHPGEPEAVGHEQPPPDVEPGNVPRVARLMALAIHFDGLLRHGNVPDYSTLARLGHVTRARLTQIMALLHLAPDIQEALLFLPRTLAGRDPITEHHLRPLVRLADWGRQRTMWKKLLRERGLHHSAALPPAVHAADSPAAA